MELCIKDRVAVVTGAGQGIGKDAAMVLAEEGADLVINDLNADAGMKTAEEIAEKTGRRVKLVEGDVSDEETARKTVEAAVKEYGRLDILINNAGISPKLPFWEISPEDFDRVLAVNLRSNFMCSKLAFELMKSNAWGRIVNLSSFAGRYGGVNSAVHYSASKAAIIGVTMTLARQMGQYNITVNCVAPGRIDTAMTRSLSEEKKREALERIPLKRFGSTREVADVIAFLASEKSAYITGTCVDIMGGYMG